jgi:hypothetical protein
MLKATAAMLQMQWVITGTWRKGKEQEPASKVERRINVKKRANQSDLTAAAVTMVFNCTTLASRAASRLQRAMQSKTNRTLLSRYALLEPACLSLTYSIAHTRRVPAQGLPPTRGEKQLRNIHQQERARE